MGIQDISRMGALRFKTELDEPFLAEDSKNSIPIWTSIRELEQASYLLQLQKSQDFSLQYDAHG